MYGWEVLGSRDTGEEITPLTRRISFRRSRKDFRLVIFSGFHGGCPDAVANRQPLVGAVSYGRVVGDRGACEEPAGVMPPVGYTPSLWVEPRDD